MKIITTKNLSKEYSSKSFSKEKILALNNLNINYIDVFYTDSISDLPLAKLSKKIILIKNDKMIACNNIEDFIKKAQ